MPATDWPAFDPRIDPGLIAKGKLAEPGNDPPRFPETRINTQTLIQHHGLWLQSIAARPFFHDKRCSQESIAAE
jgi:hypothetical protein